MNYNNNNTHAVRAIIKVFRRGNTPRNVLLHRNIIIKYDHPWNVKRVCGNSVTASNTRVYGVHALTRYTVILYYKNCYGERGKRVRGGIGRGEGEKEHTTGTLTNSLDIEELTKYYFIRQIDFPKKTYDLKYNTNTIFLCT